MQALGVRAPLRPLLVAPPQATLAAAQVPCHCRCTCCSCTLNPVCLAAAPFVPTQQGDDAVADSALALEAACEEEQPEETAADHSGKEGTAAKAFRRVKAEEWLGQKGSWDNSYEATFGQSGWGAKANQVLSKVRGKDFRHEKTKKKRGTYRGGCIEPGMVASYKFDSSDEE